jgi:hypothetical protein
MRLTIKSTMKLTPFKLFSAFSLALVLAAAPVSAREKADVQKVLKSVPAPELPAKAADLVVKAKSSDQKAVTISVVTAAIALRPASAAAVVGAIARVAPHRAALAASTAIALVPKQAAEINKASLTTAITTEKSIATAVKTEGPAADVAQAAPRTGPPFVPVPPGAPEVTPGDTTPVPPGGRDYSAP